jgi:hypothetical protein
MAINTYPAIASPVKSVQRGSAAGAGTVTITAIDITKSMVHVFGTASSGTVSASFNMSMNAGSVSLIGPRDNISTSYNLGSKPTGSTAVSGEYVGGTPSSGNAAWTMDRTVNAGNASVGAGSNNLVAAVVQGYLSNSTSLVVSGACRWEVVEFN